jgi:hypothetical protein
LVALLLTKILVTPNTFLGFISFIVRYHVLDPGFSFVIHIRLLF